MVNILANIIQIIMLSSCSNALLGVDSSLPLGHVTVRVNCAHEDGLELVHPGIGEQEGGVIQRDGRGRVDIDMLLLHRTEKLLYYNLFSIQ